MNDHVFDPETRRYGQILHAGGAVATILVLAVAYSLIYAPMVEGTDESYREIERLKAAIRTAPAVRKEHQQLKERLVDVCQRFDQLRLRVPEEAMVSQFVSQVTEAAEQDGIAISDVDTGRPCEQEGYAEREIEFTGSGRFTDVCRFVDRIRHLPRLSKVTGLGIQTEAYGQEIHPIRLRTTVYFGLNATESEQDKERDDG